MIETTDPFWRVICGDARDLSGVADESVQTIITSIPYWGLRKYIDDDQEIGREETLEDWLDNLVACAHEWRRVLRGDGTLWINCGDSYANDAKGPRSNDKTTLISPDWQIQAQPPGMQKGWRSCEAGIKRKDLLGLPWRLAFALQANGWYLRSAITWAKGLDWTDAEREAQGRVRAALALVRSYATDSFFGLSKELERSLRKAEKAIDRMVMSGSVMPESVQDRPTSGYEMLFLFSKAERYYYDRHAILVPTSSNTHSRGEGITPKGKLAEAKLVRANTGFHVATSAMIPTARNARNVWRISPEPSPPGGYQLSDGRIIAHFASYPRALVTRAILAGTSAAGACAKCGAPFVRVTRPTAGYAQLLGRDWADYEQDAKEGRGHSISPQRPTKRGAAVRASYETVQWVPTCRCYGDPIEAGVACGKCNGDGLEKAYSRGKEPYRAHLLPGRSANRQQTDHDGHDFAEPQPTGDPCPACLCPDCKGTGRETIWLTEDERRDITEPMGSKDRKLPTSAWGNREGKTETGNPCPSCLCPDCKGTGRERAYPPSQLPAGSPHKDHRGIVGKSGGLVQTLLKEGGDGMIETGNPCPTCDGVGATGLMTGDVWPDDILENWPRQPCVVLDPMAGTGQTGMAALTLGRSTILNDLSPDYCDLMRERMEAWPEDLSGPDKGGDSEEPILPLFAETAQL